jgi:hypothetical protein
MQSVGLPASSIHLGRGDYWNIPSTCIGQNRTTWNQNIVNWYKQGSKLLIDYKSEMSKFCAVEMSDKNIPEVFLESLTFPSAFSEKIRNTLNINIK